MKSLGISRSVIDFCAILGLCIAERGRYDREEFVLRNRKDNDLIPRDVSVVAEAWDNNDMKPMINLVGQENVSFCAACSVGSRNETLSLCPESKWLGLQGLSVDMVVEGQPGNDGSGVFTS